MPAHFSGTVGRVGVGAYAQAELVRRFRTTQDLEILQYKAGEQFKVSPISSGVKKIREYYHPFGERHIASENIGCNIASNGIAVTVSTTGGGGSSSLTILFLNFERGNQLVLTRHNPRMGYSIPSNRHSGKKGCTSALRDRVAKRYLSSSAIVQSGITWTLLRCLVHQATSYV